MTSNVRVLKTSKSHVSFSGLAILIASIAFLTIERSAPSAPLNIFLKIGTAFPLAYYLLKELRKNPAHLLSFYYQLFYYVFMLVSALLVSAGAYMIEISETGDANGTFWVILIFFIVGLESSKFGYIRVAQSKLRSESPRFSYGVESMLIYVIAALTLIVSIHILLQYSSPLLLNMERSTFWSNIVPEEFGFLPSLVQQTFFLILGLHWTRKSRINNPNISTILIIIYVAIAIIVLGEKFSALNLFLAMALMYVAAHEPRTRLSPKTIFLTFCIFIILILIVAFHYINIGRDVTFIETRIALQSQLTWSTLNTASFPFYGRDEAACFLGCKGYESGADYISWKYLPTAVYEHYTQGGTGLSGFLPATQIMAFGVLLSVIAHSLFSFFMGALQAYLVGQLRRNRLIYGFLIYKLYLGVVLFWYAAREIGMLVYLSLILCLAMLLASKQHKRQIDVNLSRHNPT